MALTAAELLYVDGTIPLIPISAAMFRFDMIAHAPFATVRIQLLGIAVYIAFVLLSLFISVISAMARYCQHADVTYRSQRPTTRYHPKAVGFGILAHSVPGFAAFGIEGS